jgi:hypothetical protein
MWLLLLSGVRYGFLGLAELRSSRVAALVMVNGLRDVSVSTDCDIARLGTARRRAVQKGLKLNFMVCDQSKNTGRMQCMTRNGTTFA